MLGTLDDFIRRLKANPEDGDLHAAVGFRMLEEGDDVVQALVHLAQADQRYATAFVDPRNRHASEQKIVRSLEKLGGHHRAFAAARVAAGRGETELENRHRLLARCAAGVGLFAVFAFPHEELDDLVAAREHAIKAVPDDASARFRWGAVLAVAGRVEEAIEEFEAFRSGRSDEFAFRVPALVTILRSMLELDSLAADGRADDWQSPDLAALREEAKRAHAEELQRPVAAKAAFGEQRRPTKRIEPARAEPARRRLEAETISEPVRPPDKPPARPTSVSTSVWVTRFGFGIAFDELDTPPWPGDPDEDWIERWQRRSGGSERACSVLTYGRPDHFTKYAVLVDESLVEAHLGTPVRFDTPSGADDWTVQIRSFCAAMDIPYSDPAWLLMALSDG